MNPFEADAYLKILDMREAMKSVRNNIIKSFTEEKDEDLDLDAELSVVLKGMGQCMTMLRERNGG